MGPYLPSRKKVAEATGIPEAAINLIKEFEGLHLVAYPDPLSGGKPYTIGWGTTRKPEGGEFMLGEMITMSDAERFLKYDLENRYLPPLEKIPWWNEMSDGQRSALLSFAYNLGANFYGSWGFNTLSLALRLKQWDRVPKILEMYRNPGTKVEAGLLRRRKAEGKLWRT